MVNVSDKLDIEHIVVDKDKMCIDRSTMLGRQLDYLQECADKKANKSERDLMKTFLAYTEASLVIKNMFPGTEGDKKISQLMDGFL